MSWSLWWLITQLVSGHQTCPAVCSTHEPALSSQWIWTDSPVLSDAASAEAGGFAVSEAKALLSPFLSSVSTLEAAGDAEAPNSPGHF